MIGRFPQEIRSAITNTLSVTCYRPGHRECSCGPASNQLHLRESCNSAFSGPESFWHSRLDLASSLVVVSEARGDEIAVVRFSLDSDGDFAAKSADRVVWRFEAVDGE